LRALGRADEDLYLMARRARQHTLDEHTGYHRARTLLASFDAARSTKPRKPQMEAA
jgi:hypothetical protein